MLSRSFWFVLKKWWVAEETRKLYSSCLQLSFQKSYWEQHPCDLHLLCFSSSSGAATIFSSTEGGIKLPQRILLPLAESVKKEVAVFQQRAGWEWHWTGSGCKATLCQFCTSSSPAAQSCYFSGPHKLVRIQHEDTLGPMWSAVLVPIDDNTLPLQLEGLFYFHPGRMWMRSEFRAGWSNLLLMYKPHMTNLSNI